MAVLLVSVAVVVVTVGVALIVQLDGTLARGDRLAMSTVLGSAAPGSRAQRRHDRSLSPVLYLLSSVLVLLVVATLV